MRLLGRLPVLGPFLVELLAPQTIVYRRHGDREDRVRRLRAQGLAMLTIVTGLAYLAWLSGVIDWSHPLIGGAFLGAEIGCLGLFVLASTGAWRMRFKPVVAPMSLQPVPTDILITVCGEPLPVVTRTLEAALAVRWPGVKTVYVLDDKGSDEVEALSARLGAVYVSRARDGAGNADYKAGNLNYGLARAHGEYVLTLDADQVPEPDILERLAPYLTIPRTAFVQSRQSFLVPEGDPFYCQDLVFYNTLQPAFDAHDMVLSCGSGVLYRRAALDENGGFATWNLVEDLTTSYELHSRGWKSMYYPYPLAAGLAPDTVWGVYKQRGQWAFDTMRLFFWRNPLRQRGLAWQKRINYFIIGYSYITAGFIAPLFYLIPIWTYVTGHTVLTGREIDFALWRTLYFLTMTLAMRWLFRHHEPGKQFQMLVGLFPIYALNTIRALWYPRSKPGYTVNNQWRARRTRALPPIVALTPQLALLLGNAIGPFYALLMHTTSPRIVAANACVSAIAIWSLSHVCIAALDRHSWQRERDPVTFYALPARH
jgi:cellulose synthase (UDP-forming)